VTCRLASGPVKRMKSSSGSVLVYYGTQQTPRPRLLEQSSPRTAGTIVYSADHACRNGSAL
jgi:hypothetical protein